MDLKYFNDDIILKNIPFHHYDLNNFISSDSYDENLIMLKLKSLSLDAQILLQQCAIHISVYGAGNKTFGSIRFNNDVISLIEVFKKYDIKYNNINQAFLKPDDLTPRRLVRFYRYHIQHFIKTYGRPSYLWLKYSDKNKETITHCFPGAEHIIDDPNEYQYLMNVYKILDQIQGTKFLDRLTRVGIARGLINPLKMNI